MSAPAVAGIDRPTVRILGTAYPVLLPSVRDARLHLAAVIVSLQVLGQVAFDFRLSIAQILVSLGVAGGLEFALTLARSRVIMWPASALLTGNGVAFILRVPGTEHGDWWSMRGWWLYAGTAAIAILSKYLIRFRGGHVLNPSNGALVLVFLVFGPEQADPLEFWWAPMSAWMALALAIIVAGGLAILYRLRLLLIAATYWAVFAVSIGVLAVAGHEMTARWHLGPITGAEFWRAVVLSPEILVFLFFMITDPKTIPATRAGRAAYATTVALLAALLIAPQTTEFASKVAVLGALVLVCVLRVPLVLLGERFRGRWTQRRPARFALGTAAAAGAVGLLVLAGIPARPGETARAASGPFDTLPSVTIAPSDGIATEIDQATAARIAGDLVTGLRGGTAALRASDTTRATQVAGGAWLAGLMRGVGATRVTIPSYDVRTLRLELERSTGQGPPTVLATARGIVTVESRGKPAAEAQRVPFEQTFELAEQDGRFLVVRSRSATPAFLGTPAVARVAPAVPATGTLAAVELRDVAAEVGLDFRQGAFRFGMSADPAAMMGGGVCWLDYDDDGWMDLYVVNSYADAELWRWNERGGAPRSALYRNDHGRFVDVSRGSGADLAIRGNGCVAADLDLDGRTDLYVTATGADALLWNEGDGRFTDGARAAGIDAWGWHAGAAVGDVNGDGRPDLFVAGYTDMNAPIPSSTEGFPTDHRAVADRLYVNEGGAGRPRFREVAKAAGIESAGVEHGLGAVFTDVNADGRLDLMVANDEDPNRLYVNEPRPEDGAGLGFRLRDVSEAARVDDPNAGMGIAAADFSGDGIGDLFVTNSREQLHAVHRGTAAATGAFADARPAFAEAFDPSRTGWGASWVDLDNDGDLELALANGGIPVTSLRMDAQALQILESRSRTGNAQRFADVTAAVGLQTEPVRNGRGLAAADFDNDGDPDLAINTIGGRLVLLRTAGATGNWLSVRLSRFAPGAVVTAELADGRRLVRETHAGSSYLSSEDPRVTFGLGRATRVQALTVRWPDGSVERQTDVEPNRVVTIG